MEKMFEGNIRKKFFFFALPLIFTALLSQAHNVVDTIMASHFLGDEAVAAIGSTSPFVSLLSSLFWGYGTGFSVYVAILYGAGDYDRMLNVIKINILLGVAGVLVISGITLGMYRQIFSFLKIDSDIYNDALLYFSVYIAGEVFLFVNWCGTYIANALGLTKIPFAASFMTCVLNIAGNYILIKLCGLGVLGAAIATVVSALVLDIFYIYKFAKVFKGMNLSIKGLYIDPSEFRRSFSFALPSMFQQSIMYFCTAFVSPLTNLSGSDAIAGYTVGMRVYDVNAGVYQNANRAVSTYVAQCMGAKKQSLVSKGVAVGFLQNLLFLSPFLIATVWGGKYISGLFLSNELSLHYATVFMRYCMPFVVFNVVNNLMHAVFRSSGAGRFLVTATVIYAVSRIVYSYALFPKAGMYSVYIAMALAWITEAVFGMAVYFSGKWKYKEIK